MHAINSIFTRREKPQEYAEDVFTIAAYTATYSKPIYPPITRSNLDETPEFEDSELGLTWIAGRAASDEGSDVGSDEDSAADKLLPPDVKTKAGRPRKRRIRGHSEVEPARKRRCGRCTEFGHNARSCTNPPVCSRGRRSMNS